jgi:hypothetical protein
LRFAPTVLAVLRKIPVAAHAAGRKREIVRCSPVEIRVEGYDEDLCIAFPVTARYRRADRRGIVAKEAGTHIECCVIVQQPHLGAYARLCAFIRNLLDEVSDDGCVRPCVVVETAIDLRGGAIDGNSVRGLRAGRLGLSGDPIRNHTRKPQSQQTDSE